MPICPNCGAEIKQLHGYCERKFQVYLHALTGRIIQDEIEDYCGVETYECPECEEEITELESASDEELMGFLRG